MIVRWRVPLIIGMLAFVWGNASAAVIESVDYGHFRHATVQGEANRPSRVVLFASESGAAAPVIEEIADALTDADTLVIRVDAVDYLRSIATSADGCVYPAGDFEMLSQYIQRRLGLAAYRHPILIGHGPGAALVYAVLAQAPQTFPGAISIDFCPDIAVGCALCKGKALDYDRVADKSALRLRPSTTLDSPWLVFQTQGCCACDPSAIRAFVGQVGKSRFSELKTVLGGSSIHPDGLSEIKAAVKAVATHHAQISLAPAGALDDLPLIEVPCPPGSGTWLAVIVSGDGGWAGIDSDMGDMISARGIAVVGLDSLKYFWTRRTPDGAAHDLARVIDHYRGIWQKRDILLIGYSRGADVLPFMVNRLPETMRLQVRLISLLGLSHAVSFEFHLSDWISGTSSSTDLPVQPEIVKLKGTKILCFCGEAEDDSLCPALDKDLAETVVLKGGHHFGGDYVPIVDKILSSVK